MGDRRGDGEAGGRGKVGDIKRRTLEGGVEVLYVDIVKCGLV